MCGLEWSPDGELLAVVLNGDERGEVVVVDRSGAEVARLAEEPGQQVESVSFSPDGRLLATTRWHERLDPTDMRVRIWDWERGEVVDHRHLRQRSSCSTRPAHGSRPAASSRGPPTSGTATGERVATLTGPAEIGDITFSPDGTSVATGHTDGTVRLWDPETGVQQLVLRGAGAGRPRGVQPGRLQARLGRRRRHRPRVGARPRRPHRHRQRPPHAELTDDECRQYLHT